MKSKFGKCGLPGGRLRLSAPPSRTRHPLPDRRRNPHRYVRPLDVIRSGRRLVRERTGCGLRSSRGPAEPVHSRHDLAPRVSGKKLGPVSQRGRQGEAEDATIQDLRRHADCLCGSSAVVKHGFPYRRVGATHTQAEADSGILVIWPTDRIGRRPTANGLCIIYCRPKQLKALTVLQAAS